MSEQIPDATLRAWRESLAAGGFPTPSKERWQPLRAGVVNLWEFEAIEYWYADGWAQLMGRNETGKSSLMALTTLIPWLGDTASDKIDTLGRSGKQFAYYVRPSGESDRRNDDASLFHGWLWVEYGRVRDGIEDYFTTLLYASARTGSANTRLTWCTSRGSRVRDALRLTDSRAVRPAKDVDAPGFERHPSAAAYRQQVASELLGGSVAQLENIGKLLKVTRQPKLGAQLKVDFVTGHLRDALPELSRTEVEELARGWDQLDQLRQDLDRARDAAAAVARYQRDAWQPWAQALLRLRADDVAARQTSFDQVTREERAASEELASNQQAAEQLEAARQLVHDRAVTSRAQASTLRESGAYRDASARAAHLQQKEGLAAQAATVAGRSADDAERAQQAANQAAAELWQETQQRDEAQGHLAQKEDEIRVQARAAGVDCPLPLDADQLRQAADERVTAVREVETLHTSADDAAHRADLADRTAEVTQHAADATQAELDAAWGRAQAQRDEVSAALRQWAPPEQSSLVDGWIDALPSTVEQLSLPRLTDLLRRDVHEPRRAALAARRAELGAALTQRTDRLAELARELDRLAQHQPAHTPEPELWRRRDRAGAEGSPFWKLVNPREGLGQVELSQLEAALAASNLLDAWVSTGTSADLDVFLAAGSPVDGHPRLDSVLQVDEGAGVLAELVSGILASVRLVDRVDDLPDANLPADVVAVGLDGSWRVATLSGRAAPVHDQAEWLGEAAREARRLRQLAQLRAEAAGLEAQTAELREEQADCTRRLAELDQLLARAPHDDDLRAALADCAAAQKAADRARTESDKAMELARQARVRADDLRAELRRVAQQHRLPATADQLRTVRAALSRVGSGLEIWRERAAALRLAVERCQRADEQAERRAGEARESAGRSQRDQQAHRVLAAEVDALRAAVNAEDRQVLDELTRLESAAQTAESEREALDEQRTVVAGRRGSAEQKLRDVEQRRALAAEERNLAHRALRELLDAGLVVGLPVTLPEPESSAVEHVRAQAAEIRRALRPRGWADAGHREARQANARLVESLRRTLDAKARDVRGQLEQSGRSVQVQASEPVPTVEVMVNSHGLLLPLSQAGEHLLGVCRELEGQYSDSVRETLDRLLGSTFLEHLRERIGQANRLIDDINEVLRAHPTGTDRTTLRIRLEPGSNASILAAVQGSSLMDPAVTEQVRAFLREKVDEAKRAAADEGRADWRDTLATHLDYRAWYEVALESRVADGRWGPLTTRRYAELSGGARAVMLMLPLVAALAAQYRHLPSAPRPLWLDEAFDGLDATNRSMVMSLLQRFDLDVLLAGPGRLVNVAAVPAAGIYQVVRAAAPEPGADLVAELWAGHTLQAVELPVSWLDEGPTAAPGQDSLL